MYDEMHIFLKLEQALSVVTTEL